MGAHTAKWYGKHPSIMYQFQLLQHKKKIFASLNDQ